MSDDGKWEAGIDGEEDVLAQLQDELSAGRYWVGQQDGQWRIGGGDIAEAADNSGAREAAEKVIGQLNAALRTGGLEPIRFNDRVHRPREDGSTDTTVFLQSVMVGVSGMKAVLSGGTPVPPPIPLVSLITEVESPQILAALEILEQRPHDFMYLYKVYELMEAGTDVKKLASRKERTRFTRTANHQEASGIDSRHATLNTEPPGDPMSAAEAKELILRMLETWIRSETE